MKVPISESGLIDLEAPVLPAYEVVVDGVRHWVGASITASGIVTVQPKVIGKPIARTVAAYIGRRDVIWLMRGSGRKGGDER